jgi:WD40 repeat protein
VVVGNDGEVHVAPLGPQGAGLRSAFAWQPGGGLLAISSWSNIEGVLRIFDPRAEETRVIGLQADPFNSVVWSPDGDALLAASDSWWTFVSPDGTWIRSIPIGRGSSLPLAWRP